MNETPPWWTYRADVDADSPHELGVVDGDTFDLVIDLGFNTRRPHPVRLMGVDTAETYGVAKESDEYQQGVEQTRFVRDWLREADPGTEKWPLFIETKKDESGSFGRYLVRIGRRTDGSVLNQDLRAEYPEVATDG